jgi:thymidylate synthase (FAD)
MVDCGIAPECARAVLPMCSPTRLYMAGTIRSWIHYTDLRKKSDTQEEHREIAQNILAIMREQLPVVMTSLEEGTTE